jgi:hypothetical protein
MGGSFLAPDFPLPSPKSQTPIRYRRIGVCTVFNGALTVEMLKMKIDPAMCMKTQERGHNVML